MTTLPKTLAAAAAALLLIPAAARAGSETATGGPVSATLTWDAGTTNAALAISRNGAQLFSRAIPDVICDGCKILGKADEDIAILDLDGDGENEVVTASSTGGSQCCLTMGVYDYVPQTNTYRELARDWGFAGFNLTDLDGDGTNELESTDPRFLNLFSTHASAWPPPQVWTYLHQDGVPILVDVTGKYTAAIRANAAEAKKRLRRPGEDARGYVAAYVADQYLLAKGATGRRELDRQVRRGAVTRAFRSSLLKRLHRYGYR